MNQVASLRNAWDRAAIAVLLIVLLAVLCGRLLFSAYTSGDDGYTAFAAVAPHGLIGAAKEMAVFQGRFYQLAVYPLAMLPFVSESIVLVNMAKIFTFFVFLYGFWYVCRVLLGRDAALACLALFLCVFDTVGSSYNPFHGLPLWFGLGCGLLFLSLGLHVKAVKSGHSSAWAYALFGVSLLTYEIVLLYAPLFPLISLWFGPRRNEWLTRPAIVTAMREAVPVAAYVSLYLALYMIFRHYYPGTYTGATGLTGGPFADVMRPILAFSLHAFYWNTTITGNPSFSWGSLVYAAAGLAAVGLAFRRAMSERDVKPFVDTQGRAIHWLGIAVLVAYVFVPNILFGFTDRYRIWAGDGVRFYLGSLFSAVPLTILFYLFCRWLIDIARRSTLGRAALGLGVLVLFMAVYANSKSSENFYKQSERMAVRWDIADWTAASLASQWPESFGPIVVCGAGFTHTTEMPVYSRNPDFIADAEIYWSRYLSRKSGRYVQFVNKPSGGDECLARLSLSYRQGVATLEHSGRTTRFQFPPATCVTSGTYERPAGVTRSCSP